MWKSSQDQSVSQIVATPWPQWQLGLSENRVPQKSTGLSPLSPEKKKKNIKWQSWGHSGIATCTTCTWGFGEAVRRSEHGVQSHRHRCFPRGSRSLPDGVELWWKLQRPHGHWHFLLPTQRWRWLCYVVLTTGCLRGCPVVPDAHYAVIARDCHVDICPTSRNVLELTRPSRDHTY